MFEVKFFGKDMNSVKVDLKKKVKEIHVSSSYNGSHSYCDYGIDIVEEVSGEYNPHIHIIGIDLTRNESLGDFTDNSLTLSKNYHDNIAIFLLSFISKKEPKNSRVLLLKLDLTYPEQYYNNGPSKRICNVLQQKIDEYCKCSNVLQSNVELTLTRLLGFDKLNCGVDGIEKYIQSKNKALSCCEEEGLKEQAEKFINPHNYPCYFENEIFACLGVEIVKKVVRNSKSIENKVDLLSPNTSLQSLQVLTLAAIAKATKCTR